MTRKFSSTSVATTLASGINSTSTSIVVATGTGASLMGGVTLAPGNVDSFAVALDVDTINEEIVWVTQISGDTLTVIRAEAGTSGIAHTAGATVKHVLTGDDATFFTAGVATANAAIPESVVTAKGDLLVASASGVVDNLVVGTSGYVLSADPAETLGVKWVPVVTPSSLITLNAKTGSYTLISSDLNKLVTVNSASAATITIPNGVFAVGSQINVTALGDGLVTIDSDGTTVLQATPGTVLRTKYSAATIICVATNTFLIVGDLSA
jgi:hypothetical protein